MKIKTPRKCINKEKSTRQNVSISCGGVAPRVQIFCWNPLATTAAALSEATITPKIAIQDLWSDILWRKNALKNGSLWEQAYLLIIDAFWLQYPSPSQTTNCLLVFKVNKSSTVFQMGKCQTLY